MVYLEADRWGFADFDEEDRLSLACDEEMEGLEE